MPHQCQGRRVVRTTQRHVRLLVGAGVVFLYLRLAFTTNDAHRDAPVFLSRCFLDAVTILLRKLVKKKINRLASVIGSFWAFCVCSIIEGVFSCI